MDLSFLPSFAHHYSLMSNPEDYGGPPGNPYLYPKQSPLYEDPYYGESSKDPPPLPPSDSQNFSDYPYMDNKWTSAASSGVSFCKYASTQSTPMVTTSPESYYCNTDNAGLEDQEIISQKITTDDENYITITTTTANGVVRVVKRRSANKKERRRTQSINSAFSNLRDCIPNVPADTKLSKIKTLRLATSYISYLMELLDGPRENTCKLLSEGFRADLTNAKRSSQQNRIETQNVSV